MRDTVSSEQLLENLDRPAGVEAPRPTARYGSDVIAEALAALGIPFVALNPGSSFRGLHDSLVNHLGNRSPQMLVCLHEEHAVAIAHGYAKVTGRPMAAIVHSNVGLMHATMAVYNAWCDRVPLMLLGATGPVDADKRRPWIDWTHTAQDQGALIRGYSKWDDQPASPRAAVEALFRARQIATTIPFGPVYVNFDAGLQEEPLAGPVAIPDPARFRPAPEAVPDPSEVRAVADLASRAQRPLLLVGRVSGRPEDWQARVRLAEHLGARVATDLKVGASFPSAHPLHLGGAAMLAGEAVLAAICEADLIVSLDWIDLGGTLKVALGGESPAARVVQASPDQYVHNGWSKDHQGLAPADHYVMTSPDGFVRALCRELGIEATEWREPDTAEPPRRASDDAPLSLAGLAAELRHATWGRPTTLVRAPLGWSGDYWDFRHPLDYLGADGGGGIGSGPGMTVGAALALRGSGRLPVAVLGDGDMLMGLTALWTAARYRIPLLVVVANNRSFFNDELHQERVARHRNRPVENRWIGQAIDDPAPDLAALARGLGAVGIGPVTDAHGLREALPRALEAVDNGAAVVVDAHIEPGYSAAMSASLTRS